MRLCPNLIISFKTRQSWRQKMKYINCFYLLPDGAIRGRAVLVRMAPDHLPRVGRLLVMSGTNIIKLFPLSIIDPSKCWPHIYQCTLAMAKLWCKSPTFLSNFCKGVKIFRFSSAITFGQLL